MPSVISGDANVSATEFGYLDGVTSSLQTQMDSKLNLAGGKILQIVRATDSTDRSTTSSSAVDASLSVTITPQKSDSAILLIHTTRVVPASNSFLFSSITDSSNNIVSGAQGSIGGNAAGTVNNYQVVIGYSTPATTSATTYKVRFAVSSGTGTLQNSTTGGGAQLYAIEVSA